MPLMPLSFEVAPKVDHCVFRYAIYRPYSDGRDGIPLPLNTPEQMHAAWQALVSKQCGDLHAIAVYAVPALPNGGPAEAIYDQDNGRFTGRFYDWLVLRDEHGAPILTPSIHDQRA